jgi:hypothetical protein
MGSSITAVPLDQHPGIRGVGPAAPRWGATCVAPVRGAGGLPLANPGCALTRPWAKELNRFAVDCLPHRARDTLCANRPCNVILGNLHHKGKQFRNTIGREARSCHAAPARQFVPRVVCVTDLNVVWGCREAKSRAVRPRLPGGAQSVSRALPQGAGHGLRRRSPGEPQRGFVAQPRVAA